MTSPIKASFDKELISEAKVEWAYNFLAQTDEKFARLKVQMLRKDYLLELARKKQFLMWSGTIDERKAQAECSPDVQGAIGASLDAILEYETCRGKRTTAALIIDGWRTQEASRRVGNV